ncbi:MAG: glycosyltransferase [bacterium]|nr:glycosyltransferase [bacterium]
MKNTNRYKKKPRILFLGTAKESYPSNRIKIRHLSGFVDLRTLFSDLGTYYSRTLSVFVRLPFHIWNADIFWVGWMGFQLVPIIRLLSRKPIIFDLQNSLFEAMCLDRGFCKPNSFQGRVIHLIDYYAYYFSDLVITHDVAHQKYLSHHYQVPNQKMINIPMCADFKLFYPRSSEKSNDKEKSFVVEFCGEFSPIHGVPYIIKAAKLLEDTNIVFIIAGRGQCSQEVHELYESIKPKNVILRGYISNEELIKQRSNADLSLGVFGTSIRNHLMTNKHFEITAMARPLLTLRPPLSSSGVFEFFEEDKNIFMVPPGDEHALAEKIVYLRDHEIECKAVANAGYDFYTNLCSVELQEQRIKDAVVRVYGDW